MLVRQDFRGKAIINSLIDLPFAVSPVVIGLSLLLVYGRATAGSAAGSSTTGIQIIFSVPGHGAGDDLRLAAVRRARGDAGAAGDRQRPGAGGRRRSAPTPWQTFWRVTLPAIRWGVTYGVVLATARSLGEFGAVSVVAGKDPGQTETLPLFVENQYDNFDLAGAYAAAIVLAMLAIGVLFSMNFLSGDRHEAPSPRTTTHCRVRRHRPAPIEKEA